MEDKQRTVKVVVIDPLDNVATAVDDLKAGETIMISSGKPVKNLKVSQEIPFGHKVAIASIPQNCEVIKYGEPIGTSSVTIEPGEHVHIHNMFSNRGRGDLQKANS